MRHSIAIVLLLACASPVLAQVVEVHGGASSLFDSKGGEIEIKANSYDASIGAGTIGPRLMAGAKLTKRFEGSTLTFGTETIPFNLPTDIFGGSYLTTVGGSLRKTLPSASLLLFGGMMSNNFDSPFFEATHGVQPAAILVFDGRVTPNVSLASRMLLAKQITLIEGIGWRPAQSAQFAASGGIGSGKGYGAISAMVKHSIFDLKTAYIQTSPGFRRADVDTIVTAEPDRLNATLTITPTHSFNATIGHTEYLMPVLNSPNDTRSSINQVEANTSLKGTDLSASVFRSTYQAGTNKALVIAASRAFGPRMHLQSSYLHSSSNEGKPTSSFITTVSETLTPRWTVSQVVNNANGQTTLGFGTSFLSNLATFNAEYETYYLPEHLPSPFEQVLIVNADLNLFGRATLHGDTFVSPNGTVKHTASASGVFVRNSAGVPLNDRNSMERYIIVGHVVDELNRPVGGAAILIDRVPVYTDSDGTFILRERQPRYHLLEVLGRQFLEGGEYMVVNAPHSVRSALPDDAVTAVIVVQQLPRICPRGAPCKS